MRAVVMRIPPPLFYVAAFLLGLGIERLAPPPPQLFANDAVARAFTIGAVIAFAIGIPLGPLNSIRFLVRKTTLNPTKHASVFLSRGIYAVSRNPMYLGLFFVYAGVALFNRVLWPFATAAIPFLLVDRLVIPFEESLMAERYGAEYAQYCARVGRWFSLRSPFSG